MKEQYFDPEITIQEFQFRDIIATSSEIPENTEDDPTWDPGANDPDYSFTGWG